MADRQWTKRLNQGATSSASAAKSRVRDAIGKGASLARRAGGVTADAAETVRDLISGIEGPALPLHTTWGIGLGQVLSNHPQLPDGLRSLVRQLDRFGHLELSPDAISFDGETVPWRTVDVITFGPALEVITSRALQNEAGRLAALLPPVPGRSWVVRQAVDVLVALCLAAAGSHTEGEPDAGRDTNAHGIPVRVAYGGLVHREELTPGIFAALVAASTPSISAAIAATAAHHGAQVVITPPSRSRKQAIALRRVVDSMSHRVGRQADPHAIEGGSLRELQATVQQDSNDDEPLWTEL